MEKRGFAGPGYPAPVCYAALHFGERLFLVLKKAQIVDCLTVTGCGERS
jgi:hypothetical protein